MLISTSNVNLNVEHFPSVKKETAFVFLLHGFTGSSNDWLEIIPNLNKNFSYAAVDLIGHGKSDAPDELNLYKTPSLLTQLDEVFKHFTKDQFILVGYSMGGRVALSYAAAYTENLLGLILESTSAGIADEKLRKERILQDDKVIEILEKKSLEDFFKFWMSQDLFTTLNTIPEEKLLKAKLTKLQNSKMGMINSLKGFGTGVMPPLHEKLHLVKCKTLLVTGGLDTKFTQINSELVISFPSAKHVIIKNAGHNVHFERPEEFAKAVEEFWEKLK